MEHLGPENFPWTEESEYHPMVGDHVHYLSQGSPVLPDGTQVYPSTCRTAVVTETDPGDTGLVGLCVFNPTGLQFRSLAEGGSRQAEWPGGAPGTWHPSWAHWDD